jgi:pimeloyl-ACP methyl ester carboxylesterase
MRVVSCLRFFMALLVGAALAGPVPAESIALDKAGIEGVWELPATEASAMVLILHGFNDDLNGVGGLQQNLATELALQGIASLRINFRGEGSRHNYRVTSTVTSRLEDTAKAYQWMQSQFPGKPLGVLGWSLGGMTAMLSGGAHPDWFQSMVLWSAAGNGLGLLHSSADPAFNLAARQAIAHGEAEWQSWTLMTLTAEFLTSFIGVDVVDSLGNYPGSFLSIRGSEDYLPAMESTWLPLLKNSDRAAHVIGGADHIFNILDAETQYGDTAIRLTTAWFGRTLR